MVQYYDELQALNQIATGIGTVGTNTTGLTTVFADDIASGNITTQNLNPNSGTATVGSTVALTGLNGVSGVTIQVTGTYTGALTIQGSVDGVNWVALVNVYNIGTNVWSTTISSATVGLFSVSTAGLPNVRVTALAAMTGTAAVTIDASTGFYLPAKIGIASNSPGGSIDSSINGVAPTNVLWETPAPTTSANNGCSMFFNGAPTVANVKASAGNVYGFNIFNPAAATTYLQFYNTAGTPTLGTSVIWSVGVAAGANVNVPVGPFALWNASTGIGIGASTTATSSGTPATAPVVTVFYR